MADSVGTQIALLTGTGNSAATDSITPLALVFPEQVLASNSTPKLVTLANDGDAALSLIRADITGDFSVTNNCGASLAGHSTCVFSVAFHPSRAGQSSGTLTITDMLGTHTVSLSGIGVAPAGVSIAPTYLDFGVVGVGGSSTQTLTLTNNGGLSLEGLVFAISGDFAVTANDCGDTVAGSSSCNLQIKFSPASVGSRSGNLVVTTSSAAAFNLPLNGSGMDFQLVIVGSPSATIVTGQTAEFSLSVEPVGASSGNVAITCEGEPKNSTCARLPGRGPDDRRQLNFCFRKSYYGDDNGDDQSSRSHPRDALALRRRFPRTGSFVALRYPRQAFPWTGNSVSVRCSGVVVFRLWSNGEWRKTIHSGQSRSGECDSGRQLRFEHFRDIDGYQTNHSLESYGGLEFFRRLKGPTLDRRSRGYRQGIAISGMLVRQNV